MAFVSHNIKYSTENRQQLVQSVTRCTYPAHGPIPAVRLRQTDENRNDNKCGNQEICPQTNQITIEESHKSQIIKKVDAATMTDPLQIDFRLTSEYLARCSSTLGLPYVFKYDDNSNTSNQSFQEVQPKLEFEIRQQYINGMLVYHCPDCAYKFENKEALREHLEYHKQRPHICDICGASLKRKEHLDRHKQGHNKDRPYQCTMCCKAFKRNEHLARHMIIHSGSKNQVCSECGKAFYRKDHLKKHLQSHGSTRNKSIANDSQNNQNIQNSNDEGLSSFAMMMRQAGPPPFSILRT